MALRIERLAVRHSRLEAKSWGRLRQASSQPQCVDCLPALQAKEPFSTRAYCWGSISILNPSSSKRSTTLRRIYSLAVMHCDWAARSMIGGNVWGQRACKRFGKRPGLIRLLLRRNYLTFDILQRNLFQSGPNRFFGEKLAEGPGERAGPNQPVLF